MAEEDRNRKAFISKDCIDGARKALDEDPDAEIIFINNHAYVIPTGASEKDSAVSVPLEANIAGTLFRLNIPFGSYTVGALRKAVSSGEAENITTFLSRLKKNKRR